MKLRHRTRLAVEALEDRWAPALNPIVLDAAGNLFVSGTTTSGTLEFTYNGGTSVSVTDGALVGTFDVLGKINVNLGNSVGAETVNFDFNGETTSNGIFLRLGNALGGYTVADLSGGTIAGNFDVTSGSGGDTVELNDGTDILGNCCFHLNGGVDTLTLDDGTDIGGNVSAIGVNNLNFGTGVGASPTVGGNFTISSSNEPGVLNFWFFNGVAGNLSSIGGSLNMTGGNSALDLVDIMSSIGGNLNANMGQGTNIWTLSSVGIVAGNMSYTGGSGLDVVALASTGLVGATVLGNVTVTTGNGTNTFVIDTASFIGGSSIQYIGGTGVDSVTYRGQAPGATLNARLGAGTDIFNLDDATLTLGALVIDFGLGVDTFNSTIVISFPTTLRNLP